MASPAEVANDLEAQAIKLRGRGMDHLVSSLSRGARTIRDMLETISEMDAAAEAMQDKYTSYLMGQDE